MSVLVFQVSGSRIGAPWTVRKLVKGDAYGVGLCLTWESEEPGVEIYDSRYPHTPFGQFVSRYFISTLRQRDPHIGLALHGGVEAWTMTAEEVREMMARL